MLKPLSYLATFSLFAGSASAATYIIQDGATPPSSGAAFGATNGVALAVDTTYNTAFSANSPLWEPDLVAGQSYFLNSITLYSSGSANADPTALFLSVFNSSFAGFDGDTAAEHLGFSTNSVSFTGGTGQAVTWNFSGIQVTADSDGSLTTGSGTLYFFFDDDTTRNNLNAGPQRAVFRMDANTAGNTVGSGVMSGNTAAPITDRAPEMQAQLTAVPEPTTFAMLLGGVGVLIGFQRRRNG